MNATSFPAVLGVPTLGRCRVMGVINVTPDSFSDGGSFVDPDRAVAHGLALLDEGADILDVGGESTRPGAARVSAEEEARRVAPVVRALAATGALVSIDTTRASVAEQALELGAGMVNDISGGRADPALPRLVGAAGVPYVITHSRGNSLTMASLVDYADVLGEVRAELLGALRSAVDAGVDPQATILDPGLGFAKTPAHNWTLLAGLSGLRALGRPLLVGASRKSFLGQLLAAPDGTPRPVTGRDDATVALSALAACSGAWCVRVHQVRGSADAVRVAAALRPVGT